MARVLGDRAEALLELYPHFIQQDQTLQAVCAALGPEFDLLDESIEMLERSLAPSTADEHLDIYETMLGISVSNPNLTQEERLEQVLGHMKRVIMGQSTFEVERVMDFLLGQQWTYTWEDPNRHVWVVNIPYAEGSLQAELAEVLLEMIAPAVAQINVAYASAGFFLDDSSLDSDLL